MLTHFYRRLKKMSTGRQGIIPPTFSSPWLTYTHNKLPIHAYRKIRLYYALSGKNTNVERHFLSKGESLESFLCVMYYSPFFLIFICINTRENYNKDVVKFLIRIWKDYHVIHSNYLGRPYIGVFFRNKKG